jgi:hypothetical protein
MSNLHLTSSRLASRLQHLLLLSLALCAGAGNPQCQGKIPYHANIGDACTGTGWASTCCSPKEDTLWLKCGVHKTCCFPEEGPQLINLPRNGTGSCQNYDTSKGYGFSSECCSGQCVKRIRPGRPVYVFFTCKTDQVSNASKVSNATKVWKRHTGFRCC